MLKPVMHVMHTTRLLVTANCVTVVQSLKHAQHVHIILLVLPGNITTMKQSTLQLHAIAVGSVVETG